MGTQDKIETVSEYKVELVCAEEFLTKVIKALNTTHPYEEVAYSVFRIESGIAEAD